MASYALPVFVLSLAFSAGVSMAAVSISMDVSQSHAHPGENITMVCRISGMSSPNYIIYIGKTMTHEDGRTFNELISTNDIINEPYLTTRRFQVNIEEAGDVDMFIMNIYKVTTEDSGHYACTVPKEEDATAIVSFEVYKNPSEVSFDNVTETGVINFEAGRPQKVVCRVKQALPVPRVEVWLSGSDTTGTFQKNPMLNVQCEGAHGSKTCLLHFDYDVILTDHALTVNHAHDEGHLTCRAIVANSGYAPVETRVGISVMHVPMFNCEKTLKTKLHTKNYQIKCIVSANPGLEDIYWQFSLGGDSIVMLRVHELTEDGDISASIETIGSKNTFMLHIADIYAYHFTKYTIVANSTRGLGEFSIDLVEEKDTKPVVGGGATGLSISTACSVLVLCAFLLARGQH